MDWAGLEIVPCIMCGSYSLAIVCLAVHLIASQAAILRVGNPLQWHASKPFLQHVRLSGVEQFINHYKRCEGSELPLFVWGDEIEYGVFRRDDRQHFDLALNATQIREKLTHIEKKCADLPIGCEWQPEYGSWMVEAVPRSPFGSYVSDLPNVEKSMQLRRKRLHYVLGDNEIAPTTSNFPMLGVEGYEHSRGVGGGVAQSALVSDRVINPHPRFAALTRNIRQRRGSTVDIKVPRACGDGSIEMDAMAFGMGCCCLQVTMQLRNEAMSRYLHDQLLVIAPILQALSAATPFMKGELAATDTRWDAISQAVDDRTAAERGAGASPADPALAGGGVRPLHRSRYSSSCLYFAQALDEGDAARLAALNDVPVDVDEAVRQRAMDRGLDQSLATHLAHLFTRDPLVIFDDAIALDNATTLDHFENIQSTNWRSLRWKPPALRLGLARAATTPVPFEKRGEGDQRSAEDVEEGLDVDFDHNILVEDRDDFCVTPDDEGDRADTSRAPDADLQQLGPGWRVEFRPLEVQLTDFENAAFAIFTVLLSRCVLAQRHNFYLPMSLVEENLRRAQQRDAVLTQKFFFRRNCLSDAPETADAQLRVAPGAEAASHAPPRPPRREDVDVAELSLDEILNGEKPNQPHNAHLPAPRLFPGLVPLVQRYMDSVGCVDSLAVAAALAPYLDLLSDRAAGKLPTTAHYLRDLVQRHPQYRGDGRLTAAIADDLLRHCDDVGMGRVAAPALYGARAKVKNLDEVDDEDLMFSDSACFMRPQPAAPADAPAVTGEESPAVPADEAGGFLVRAVRELWRRRPWRRPRQSPSDYLRF